MTEITLHGARPPGAPHPRLGYAMVTTASALFAVNGTVSKLILTGSEITSLRLTELRATGAFAGLAAFLIVTAPRLLRVAREEVALLVFYGIVGFALVQWLYLVAIERLPEVADLWETSYGVTLLVKIGLVLVALAWGGFHHTFVRPRLERGEMPRGVGRSLLGESAVAMGVLLAAAVLVNGAPPPVETGSTSAQPSASR